MVISVIFAVLLAFLFAPSASWAQGELLRFQLLPGESKIVTEISGSFGGTVTGELSLLDGEVRGQISDLKGTGWVRLTIIMASYNSDLGLRDQDVRDNYLEAAKYPAATFTSTAIEEVREPKSPEEAWQLTVRGILDLHGVKKEIRVPVKVTFQGRKILAEGVTKILLKDFNIAVPTLLFFLRSGDQVEVTFRFVGEQQP